MKRAIPFIVAGLVLAGCAAQPTAAPTPTPAPDATPEQVASVIAEYEADWRETIGEAADCRFIWTFAATAADEINGMSCWLREQTMVTTAQIVIRDWNELDIPSSMSSLVDSTTAVLEEIGGTDLEAVCGSGDVPVEETTCNQTLGSLNFLYGMLEGELDAWRVYL